MHRGSRCFWGGRLPCHRTLQTTCLEHFQSWDRPSSQATCKGQLALLLNKRDVRKQKLADSSLTYVWITFGRHHVSSEECVKGKVVTDVGQDLGGGSTGSWEMSGSEELRKTAVHKWYLQVISRRVGMNDVGKIFWAISITLPFFILSRSRKLNELRTNKGKDFFLHLLLYWNLYMRARLWLEWFLLSKNLDC